MEHLQSNPFYEKYSQKLKSLQQSSSDEFNSRIASLLEEKKLDQTTTSNEKMFKENQNESSQLKADTLDSIMNMDLVREKPAEEITELWKKYFENKDVIYAILPAEEYKEIQLKSKDFPLFVYPLPRGEGYEFFVQHWNGNGCHLTPLLSYQTHKENSPACLSLKHYTELADDKGIVLMVGHPDMNILSVSESQLLALQVKMYYGIQSALKFNLVRVFNNSPSTFKYMELIKEFENYKKDVENKKKAAS